MTAGIGVDFVLILPAEVSVLIFSKLELKDILNCAQVSRCWNGITADPLLWYRFCHRIGLVGDSNQNNCLKTPLINRSSSSFSPQNDLVCSPQPPYSPLLGDSPDHYTCNTFSVPTVKKTALSCPGHHGDWRHLCQRYLQTQCNWRNGRPSYVFTLAAHHNRIITCMTVYNDWIITGSDDYSICVWSLSQRTRLISLFGHRGGVWSLDVVPRIPSDQPTASRPHRHCPLLISGSCDRTGRVWLMDDAHRWPCVATLFGHQSTVRCIASCKPACNLAGSPVKSGPEPGDCRLVVTGSRDATLRLWEADTGRCIHILKGHRGAIRSVQFAGDVIASGSYDCTVRLWSAGTGQCLHRLTAHTNRVYTLLFDGYWVISASLDTTIRVWHATSGHLQATLSGHQSLTSSLALGPPTDQPRILISSNADGTIRVWSLLTGVCLHVLAGPNKHQSVVTDVQLMRNFIISSSDDGTVKLWDRSNGGYIRDLVRLDAAGRGAVVWRLLIVGDSQLVCAVGSRNGLETSKVVVLQFHNPSDDLSGHSCAFPLTPAPSPRLSELVADLQKT